MIIPKGLERGHAWKDMVPEVTDLHVHFCVLWLCSECPQEPQLSATAWWMINRMLSVMAQCIRNRTLQCPPHYRACLWSSKDVWLFAGLVKSLVTEVSRVSLM